MITLENIDQVAPTTQNNYRDESTFIIKNMKSSPEKYDPKVDEDRLETEEDNEMLYSSFVHNRISSNAFVTSICDNITYRNHKG